MAINNTLSPSLMSALIEQAAAGKLGVASLVGNVQNDSPVAFGNVSAVFHKNAPRDFVVTMSKDGQQQGQTMAASPVEAKLLVLEYVISQAKLLQKQPA